MAKLFNLARMTTATTGTGPITLGSAVAGYLTFAQAGVASSDVVDYAIKDGNNSEIGRGVYNSSGTTLTRSVVNSTNSNAASLSGAAEVFISPLATTIQQVPAGQCKLVWTNSSVLTLRPLNGNFLRIAGENWPIPAAGVTLSGTGLPDGIVYYVYAYMNSGTMTLEASTTGHAYDTTAGNVGVEIKLFDNSRSLVGMFVKASGSFFDTASMRYTRSWFNEDGVSCHLNSTSPPTITTTSTGTVEIDAAARIFGLMWAGEFYQQIVYSTLNNTSAVTSTRLACMPNGVASGETPFWQPSLGGGFNAPGSCTFGASVSADAVNYFAMGGNVSAGSGSFSTRINTLQTRRRQ